MKKIILLTVLWLSFLYGMGQSVAGVQRFTETKMDVPSGGGFFTLHYQIQPGYTVWQVYDSFVNQLQNVIGCNWLTVKRPTDSADYYFVVSYTANTTGSSRSLRIRSESNMCMVTQEAAFTLQVYAVSGNTQTRTVSLSGSQTGVTYRLKRSGTVVQTKPGTGFGFSFNGDVPPGTYSVEAVKGSAVKTMQGQVTFAPFAENKIITTTYREPGGYGNTRDIVFFDGLGRMIQEKSIAATPAGKDLVTPVIPDFLGRDVGGLLAYPALSSVSYTGTALSDQAGYYRSLYGSEGNYARVSKKYESSALNRILEESKPGEAYRPGGGHTIRYGYGTNGSGEVKRLGTLASTLVSLGYYEAGTLKRTEVTDEDGKRSVVYTNEAGNTVLERRYIDASNTADTYYIYDALNRLLCVVPPAVNTSATVSSADLDNYCYRYTYNAKGELSSRKLPGVAAETYTYDAAHRMISKTSGDKYTAYEYDALGRLIREKCRYGSSSALVVLAEYAYKTRPSDAVLNFAAVTGFGATADTRTAGLKVYEKLRILDGKMQVLHTSSAGYIERAFYYDRKGRLIQTVEKNRRGGISRYSVSYDFVGNVVAVQESHTVNGVTTTVKQVNTYDNRNRLLSQTVYLGGEEKAKTTYVYNELGQLQNVTYGNNLYTDTRAYNIRGLQTRQSGTQFTMNLRYENPTKGTACYNGNISEWDCVFPLKNTSLYTFTYDNLNRFAGNEYYENNIKRIAYFEQGITYDKNGNLLTLNRQSTGLSSKAYTYQYTGNRLTGLNVSGVNGTYTYDNYGNMLSDSRKALNLEYNFLNLLSGVILSGSRVATYTYASDGTKLSVVGADGRGYEYYGSLIYQINGSSLTFESAGFNEGRIYSGGACYHIKDHLGSIRLVMDQTGSVKEQNDYYPFGMRQERSNYALFAGNRFKYNVKEEQTTGGLGYLDYGARMYDAESGRWFGVDPLSEKYYGISPYAYCGNNPLIYIDPDGQLSTHYVDKYYNVIFQSSDKSDDVIKVPDDRIADFLALLQASSWDVKYINSSGFNDYLKGEYGLADYQFSEAQLNALDQFSTTWSRNNAARYMLNPTMVNALRMGWSEALSQWTNPELVATGLSAGILGMKGMTRGGGKFTRSNLKLGQQMHKMYHAGEMGKEFHLPSGKRIDFLDIDNGVIYELKPNNPRAIQQGQRQLDMYLKELQTIPRFQNIQWKTVLDTY